MTDWIEEALYPGWGQRFRVLSVLAHETSPFQDIVIFQSETHGRVLMLDGCVQITEADEFVYQEMLVHVPMLVHGAARRVLVIGAGDGGVLRRVLQHGVVERVVMVEIDEAVVRLSKQHLPAIGGDCWTDARATVLIDDGIKHVADAADNSYDVIIVDSTDPVGVGETLFTETFYGECARVLGDRGIIVTQSGVPFMQASELAEASARRRTSFASVTAYVAAVPTYVGGFMTLGLSSRGPLVGLDNVELIRQRATAAGIIGTTRYWTPGVQAAAFQLPPYIAELLPS